MNEFYSQLTGFIFSSLVSLEVIEKQKIRYCVGAGNQGQTCAQIFHLKCNSLWMLNIKAWILIRVDMFCDKHQLRFTFFTSLVHSTQFSTSQALIKYQFSNYLSQRANWKWFFQLHSFSFWLRLFFFFMIILRKKGNFKMRCNVTSSN